MQNQASHFKYKDMRIKACSQKMVSPISNEMMLIFKVYKVHTFLIPALLLLEWDLFFLPSGPRKDKYVIIFLENELSLS